MTTYPLLLANVCIQWSHALPGPRVIEVIATETIHTITTDPFVSHRCFRPLSSLSRMPRLSRHHLENLSPCPRRGTRYPVYIDPCKDVLLMGGMDVLYDFLSFSDQDPSLAVVAQYGVRFLAVDHL